MFFVVSTSNNSNEFVEYLLVTKLNIDINLKYDLIQMYFVIRLHYDIIFSMYWS